MPFGRDGVLQDTMEEVSPLVTTLISAGALGTKMEKIQLIDVGNISKEDVFLMIKIIHPFDFNVIKPYFITVYSCILKMGH